MRAGVHTGRPQRIGSDWLGVDVNIAARVMERAARGGLVVSQATMDRIPDEDFDALGLSAKRIRKQVFSPKQDGVPADLAMYRVKTRRELPGDDEENEDRRRRIVVGEMLFGLLRALARIRVTVAYAVILTGVTTVLAVARPAGAGPSHPPCQHKPAQPEPRPSRHAASSARSSSTQGRSMSGCPAWCACWRSPNCCGAAVGWWWRSRSATSAPRCWSRSGSPRRSSSAGCPTDVTRATDVGMSYGASAVLGALSAAIPRRWRPAWTGWWLAVAAVVVAVEQGLHRCRSRGGADARHARLGPVRTSRTVDAGAVSAARRRVGVRLSDAGQQRPDVDRGVRAGCGRCRARRGRGGPAAGPAAGFAIGRHRLRASASSRDTALTTRSPMIAGWLISP